MVILYFGDIFGKPGRKAIRAALPDLRATYQPDIIIGNVENLAGGRGVNHKVYEEMLEMGFHGFTSGNHIWDHKDVYSIIQSDERLLRPMNYPSHGEPCPGRGCGVIRNGSHQVFVINLMGRVFMDQVDCPFAAADKAIAQAPSALPILVDMHADATSEMYAMGFYLDGRVSAVVGSHSHVQTADERLLPKGTAYITDVGMSGAWDSVIGLKPEEIIQRFITKRPQRTQQAKENPGVCCVIIHIEPNKKATKIERLRFPVTVTERLEERDLE